MRLLLRVSAEIGGGGGRFLVHVIGFCGSSAQSWGNIVRKKLGVVKTRRASVRSCQHCVSSINAFTRACVFVCMWRQQRSKGSSDYLATRPADPARHKQSGQPTHTRTQNTQNTTAELNAGGGFSDTWFCGFTSTPRLQCVSHTEPTFDSGRSVRSDLIFGVLGVR